jgi:hypothetical protein
MYIVVKSLYPTDKVKAVAQRYLEAMKKYPDDASLATPIVPATVHATLEGMTVTVIAEAKKGKLEDVYAIAVNRMVMFQDIQGFEYTIETHLNLEEAMGAIGM